MKKIGLLLLIFGLVLSSFNYSAFAQTEEEYEEEEYYEEEYDEDEYYDDEYDDEYYEDDIDYGELAREKKVKYDPFTITAQLGFKLTSGEFGKFYGNTFGYFLMAEYKFSPVFAIGLKSGYLNWNTEGDNTEDEYSYMDIPAVAQILFYFSKSRNFQAYAGIETGMHFLTYTYKQVQFDEKTNRRRTFEYPKDYTEFGLSPMFGVLIPFGGFNLNFSAKYAMIYHDFGEESINYFGINGGVSFGF